MKHLLTAIGVVLFCALLEVQGNAAVSTYTFSPNETTVPTAVDLTFGTFQRQNVTAATQSGTLRSSGWNTGSSVDLTEYVEFTISVTPGNQLTLSSLSFAINSSKSSGNNDGGPLNLRVSVLAGIFAPGSGNGNTPLTSLSQSISANGKSQTITWDLPDQTTTTGFTLRFYGWGAENTSGTLAFDNVAVTTTVAPVPEPVTTSACAFGMVFLGANMICRKRRMAGTSSFQCRGFQ
jgi:hypothetical protein